MKKNFFYDVVGKSEKYLSERERWKRRKRSDGLYAVIGIILTIPSFFMDWRFGIFLVLLTAYFVFDFIRITKKEIAKGKEMYEADEKAKEKQEKEVLETDFSETDTEPDDFDF